MLGYFSKVPCTYGLMVSNESPTTTPDSDSILLDNWDLLILHAKCPNHTSRQSICAHQIAILLGKNDSDREFLCNFFAKNCSCKSFDVKTTDDLISLISSRSITLKSFTELLLNKLLPCCNFPSIVAMLLWLSRSTDN